MRTVKNTHNIKLREKARLGEMGLKYRCVVKIGFQKNTCNLKLLGATFLLTVFKY